MAASKGGGATIELQEKSLNNARLQMEKLNKLAPELMYRALVTLLFDIKALAQMKLKSDRHIKTSRLRNSIFVKSFNQQHARKPDNSDTYSADGKSYSSELQVDLNLNEAAVGTNVEYAGAIEFGYPAHEIRVKNAKQLMKKEKGVWSFFGKSVQHPGFRGDSFLYWALKNVDADKRWRETSKELLNGLKI